jgi:hypothetical protein
MARTSRFLTRLTVAVAATALLGGQPAAAQLIYDNGGPNGVSGNEMTSWIQAQDFTLANDGLPLADVAAELLERLGWARIAA